MLFPTVGWPMTSALAANFAYLYTLPLCTFFSSLYHNVVIQSTLLQHCDILQLLIPLLVIVLTLNLLNSNRLLSDSKCIIKGNLLAVSFVEAICAISFPNGLNEAF